MTDHRSGLPYRLALPLSLALLASACSGVVEIVQPTKSGPVAAAPNFAVKIGGNYVNGFNADLDGTPITSWFTPAAAPNTTVTALVPGCFASSSHELVARANSTSTGAGIVVDNDVADFDVPTLQFQPAALREMRPGQTVTVLMNLTVASGAAMGVALEPSTTRVSVNGAPAGSPSTTTIPNNNVGSFTVTAVAPGSFFIKANARGVRCINLGGTVR